MAICETDILMWHGFIYDNPTSKYVAHVPMAIGIGHGAPDSHRDALHHTFSDESESYHAPQGTTPNLMDYSGGTALNHLQWQWMHESHTNLLGFLDDESEGEEIKENINYLFKQNYLHTISELKKFKLFRFIYDYIVDSDDIAIVDVGNYVGDNVLGEFYAAKEKVTDGDIVLPGNKNNPHLIIFYRTNGKQLNVSMSTVFEEFFHFAHYIYNPKRSYIQTEVEVELAQALMYYINNHHIDNEYSTEMDEYMDTYLVNKNMSDFSSALFGDIVNNRFNDYDFYNDDLNYILWLSQYIFNTKKNDYKKFDFGTYDDECEFFQFLIDNIYIKK